MLQESNLRIQYEKDDFPSDFINVTQVMPKDEGIYFNMEHALLGKRGAKKKNNDLRRVILNNKVKLLTRNFIKKLKMNSVYRKPTEDQEDSDEGQEKIESFQSCLNFVKKKIAKTEGLNLNSLALVTWAFVNIIQITLMIFIFSIMMAFPETKEFELFLYFRIFSVLLYIIDMILNFCTQRYESGKSLIQVDQIARYYLDNGFMIDLVSIFIFPIDLLINSNITIIISFVSIFKLANNIKKFEKFEHLFITSSEKEQYYGLIKVFMTNFAIGHFLSVALNLMAMIDTQNWYTKVGIAHSQWYIKYIWGYYWGTNIMLTVGFGDLSATNYYEAVILIFVETFSCITLAYNISYVGALIGSIRENQVEKKKKLKTFHRMCKQNEIPAEIEQKICNFIEESYQIKEQFQNDTHVEVLQSLPKSMQKEYRIQANKILFDGLGFLSNLCKKSLLRLAEEVSRKICHPEEVLLKRGCISDFMILQKGNLASVCRVRSELDGKIIECLEVEETAKPKILSLDFIKNKTMNYNVKSTSYTIIYYLSRENFMEAIRSSDIDYQLFCVLRDRGEYMIDENNLYLCPICKNEYHSKFECSRLHYTPLKQSFILKYIQKVNKAKQSRVKTFSRIKNTVNAALSYECLKKNQKRYIQDNFDDEHYKEIEALLSFYNGVNNSDSGMMSLKKTETFKTFNTNSRKRKTILAEAHHHKTVLDQKTLYRLEEILSARQKQNQFWDLEIDEAHNFRYYFDKSNPSNLNTTRRRKRDITNEVINKLIP